MDTTEVTVQSYDTDDPEEALFHIAHRELYKRIAESGEAYFYPTFEADSMFTHVAAVTSSLIATANHLYTVTKLYWICLQISRSALHNIGIVTKFEEPKPVGQSEVGETRNQVFLHIFGGIPTEVLGFFTIVYEMNHDTEGNFIYIYG